MENKKKKLSAYYKPYKGLFLADMVFAMIGAAITLVIPLMVRYILPSFGCRSPLRRPHSDKISHKLELAAHEKLF